MKPIIVGLVVGVAFAALSGAGPALAARARQKCLDMFETGSCPCSPAASPGCAGAAPAEQ